MRMFKEKLLTVLLSTSVIIGLSGLHTQLAYASQLTFEKVDYIKQNEIRVIKDNTTIEFDIKPQIIDNRTLVPMRAIFEEMQLEVEWNQKEQLAIGFDKNNKIIFKINSKTAKINNSEKTLDVPAQIIKGRTLIPLRFLSENMGYNVVWIQESNLILISDDKISDEWKYAGTEKENQNKEYERRYINGYKTPFTRYVGSSKVLYGIHDISNDSDEKPVIEEPIDENLKDISSGRVTASRLNFRKDNDIASSIIGVIEKDSIVKILNIDGDWLNVEYSAQIGWVHKDYVDIIENTTEEPTEEPKAEIITGIVTTENLNFREGNGVNYAVISELEKGTVVGILKADGYWLNVEFEGKTGWVHKDYVEIINDEPASNQGSEDIFKIYLSPSNQPANLYAVGDTTEKIQMENLADRIKEILETEYVCDVKIGSVLGQTYLGRPDEAKKFKADVYLAIHSNASVSKVQTGAVGFYHPDYLKSWLLTNNIIHEINAIDPYESITFLQIKNGMAPFDGFGYGEIRTPHNEGIMPVLIETEFHDNPITANWIIDNTDVIARAYVNGLVKTFNLPLK